MPEQYLGIDIRDEFVSLALVAKTWGGVDMVRSHWFRLFPEQGSEETESHFEQELKDFLQVTKVKPKAVILSLPRQNSTVQSFDLPATGAEALDSMIQLEMERHFAFPLDSLSVSYHVVPIESNRNHILAVAAKKEPIQQVLNGLARSGLKAQAVDLSLFSQINVLNQNGETGPELQAIVDISSNRVDVSLTRGKTLITSRSVSIPGEDFKNMFFHHDLPESLTDRVAEDFSSFLAEVLESTLYGCKSLDSDESITQIHIFGGGHGLEYLLAPIQTHTGVKTEAVLPTFMKKDSPLSFLPAFHMTALGLALRPAMQKPIELNLHPEARRQKTGKSKWKSTVVLSVMIPAVLAGLLLGQTYRNNSILDSLDRQLEEIKPQAAQLLKIDQHYASLSSYTGSLNAIERGSPLKLPLLKELSHTLPKDTWVTRIAIKQNQIEIQGYSASASKLIPRLEKSDFFKDAQFKGSVTTKAQGKRFTIRSTMEPRG